MADRSRRRNPSLPGLLTFARSFFRHPVMLGSMIPSSSFLVSRLLRHVDWRSARVVVEYGPGVGTFTTQILQRLRHEGVLVAIETNPDFVDFLRRAIRDPRLIIVQGSASEVRPILRGLRIKPADCVISGIPYATISHHQRRRILMETKAALAPGGTLLVYQFSAAVRGELETLFGSVQQELEPRNILPARIFRAANVPPHWPTVEAA